MSRGDQVSILSGVNEGDEIVTGGQLKLKNNSFVAHQSLVVRFCVIDGFFVGAFICQSPKNIAHIPIFIFCFFQNAQGSISLPFVDSAAQSADTACFWKTVVSL